MTGARCWERGLWSHFFCHTGECATFVGLLSPRPQTLNFPSLNTNLPTGQPTTGVPCEPSYPINKRDKKRRVSHEFLPQNAINFHQQPPSRQEPPEQEACPANSPSSVGPGPRGCRRGGQARPLRSASSPTGSSKGPPTRRRRGSSNRESRGTAGREARSGCRCRRRYCKSSEL